MEIGGHRGQKFKAWYGDKVLNAAVARELMKEKHRPRHNAVIYHAWKCRIKLVFIYQGENIIT